MQFWGTQSNSYLYLSVMTIWLMKPHSVNKGDYSTMSGRFDTWLGSTRLKLFFQQLGYRLYCLRTQRGKQVRYLLQRVGILRIYGSFLESKDNRLCPVPRSQLDACLMQTYFHSIGGYEKLLADLLISEATGNQGDNLALPLGQLGIL